MKKIHKYYFDINRLTICIKHIIARRYLLLIMLLLISKLNYAARISNTQARIVAENFIKSKIDGASYKAILHYQQTEADGTVNFYIFNFLAQKGFVIVTADDRVKPVIAYSTESSFNISIAKKSGVSWWMNKMQEQIRSAKKNNYQPEPGIVQQWNTYLSGAPVMSIQSTAVVPLLNTTWDQSPGYNSLCPDNGSGDTCLAGCVATGMAQIMKYWNYPPYGTGSHSYTDNHGSITGPHTVNLGSTNYNWANMPLNSSNSDIATLMYHCGVSVEMDYEIGESGACAFLGALCTIFTNYSGHTARDAFMDQFGYETPNGQTRAAFFGDWINMLKGELDLHRPILYSGVDVFPIVAHVWVVDGYDNNDNFHMNWGWGGDENGYYEIDDLTPGTHSYNDFEGALIEIRPASLSGCDPHFNLTGTQTDSYYTWQASDYITSTKFINNKTCTYSAENFITLKKGFEAKGSNINVTSRIDQCKTPRFAGNPSINMAEVNYTQTLSVFPNPTHQMVNIGYLSSENGTYQITLLNVLGQILKTVNGNSLEGENNIELNVEKLTKGIYQLLFVQNDIREVKKLVIE